MMPKASVRPAAIRKSMTPYCRPLRTCSRRRSGLIAAAPSSGDGGSQQKGARLCRAPSASGWTRLPLHPAVLVVRVLVVLEHRLLNLRDVLPVGALDDLEKVEVLDRKVVDVVLEAPSRRLEVGLPHGRDHPGLVVEIALDGAHRGVDEQHAVVALGAVEGRRVPELLPEVGDVAPVRLVAEIAA